MAVVVPGAKTDKEGPAFQLDPVLPKNYCLVTICSSSATHLKTCRTAQNFVTTEVESSGKHVFVILASQLGGCPKLWWEGEWEHSWEI